MSRCALSYVFASTECELQRLAGRCVFSSAKSPTREEERRRDMGERFVVVPVDGGGGVVGEGEHSDAVVSDPAPDTGSGGKEAGEDSVFEQQDPNAVVPILEYNREPNKYGKTAASYKLRVPLLISSHLSNLPEDYLSHFTRAVCVCIIMLPGRQHPKTEHIHLTFLLSLTKTLKQCKT